MSWFRVASVGVLVGGAFGCDEAAFELGAEDVAQTFRGAFSGDNTCLDGEVELAVHEESEDGWFVGEYRWRTAHEGFPAIGTTYAVEGALDGGVLQLVQTGQIDAEPLPWGWSWCHGELELGGLDGGLAGSWQANDCSCEGSLELSPVEG